MSQVDAVSDTPAVQCKFFANPDLMGILLPYLDSGSTLCLVQSDISCTLDLLQKSTVEWNKLVQRVLPDDLKRENRVHIRTLISILRRMDDATAANSHIPNLLEAICNRGAPESGYEKHIKLKIVGPRHSRHLVSIQGFLLLEEVEGAFQTAMQEVASCEFSADAGFSMFTKAFKEPLLSALAARVARQQHQMALVTPNWVTLSNRASAEAIFTLVKN